MALFWCVEALPLAVTALFPLILFPMMGIMDASEVSLPPSAGRRAPGEGGVYSRMLLTQEASPQAGPTAEAPAPSLLCRSESTEGGVS